MEEEEFLGSGMRTLGYEIKTLDHMIGRRIMNISLKNGMDQVTVMHGWIMGYLYSNQDKEIFQKDLEKKFCITRSTVTNILKLMEKKGYIRRVSVERDARLKKLILTDKAKEIQRQNHIDIHNMVEMQLIQNIPPEDVEVFSRVLRRMKENMREEPKELGQEPSGPGAEGFRGGFGNCIMCREEE